MVHRRGILFVSIKKDLLKMKTKLTVYDIPIHHTNNKNHIN
nr:MAG TPA: hypothetical protein [Caudoviricetes sp.]